MTTNFFSYRFKHGDIVRTGIDDDFIPEYVRPVKEVSRFKDAMLSSCYKIMTEAPSTPCVLYSGGIDSEIIITGFNLLGYKVGHDFHIRHGVYSGLGNAHDTEHTRSVKGVEYIPILTDEYYRSKECFDFCVANKISYVTMTPVARLLLSACEEGLYPIVGHGDPQVFVEDGEVLHCDYEFQQTWLKMTKINKVAAHVDFYRSGEEIYQAFLQYLLPRIDKDANEFKFFNTATPFVKAALYGDLISGVQRRKWTGHENYRTPEIDLINLEIQKHTNYTVYSRRTSPIEKFLKSWSYS